MDEPLPPIPDNLPPVFIDKKPLVSGVPLAELEELPPES